MRKKKRRRRGFGRAILPPGRFHTTKKGKRGYSRLRSREEGRKAMGEEPEERG